jgi:hypothetical protein
VPDGAALIHAQSTVDRSNARRRWRYLGRAIIKRFEETFQQRLPFLKTLLFGKQRSEPTVQCFKFGMHGR